MGNTEYIFRIFYLIHLQNEENYSTRVWNKF